MKHLSSTASRFPTIIVAQKYPALPISQILPLVRSAFNEKCEIIESNFEHVAEKTIHLSMNMGCILIDADQARNECLETIQALKSHFTTYHIPIIVVTREISQTFITQIIDYGADDYLIQPFQQDELALRINLALQRTQRDQSCNPLTKLPGNAIINKMTSMRLQETLTLLHIDIDHFKAYNDKYGFEKGDEVLKNTAHILSSVVLKFGSSKDFLGHLGGDDFIILSSPHYASRLATLICQTFDAVAPSWYTSEDLLQKKIYVLDRRGTLQEYPLMTLSIAGVSNEHRKITSMAHIAQIAAEVKAYVKSKPEGAFKSTFLQDRRKE